ncbi:MAG: hypothetical protein ACLVJH_15250 [Faecalibacterium prausnitzii]
MLDWNPQPPYTAEQLLQVIRILRDPENGCPWDKVQTHASIRKNFLEETCEALEAIDADDAVSAPGGAGRRADAGGVPRRHGGRAGTLYL